MGSQNSEILNYLKAGHSITTMVATVKLGVCRLSERVRELEAIGVKIARESIFIENRHGRRVRITAYRLGE